MLVHGIAPSNLLIGTMTPIIKNNRESHNRSNNYRTLTIGTCLHGCIIPGNSATKLPGKQAKSSRNPESRKGKGKK